MYTGRIWPAAAPGHCHVVEVEGMGPEEKQRQSSTRNSNVHSFHNGTSDLAGKRKMEA